MKHKILRIFVNAIIFSSITTTAWATSNWWRSQNQPIEPTPSISSEPVQKSNSNSPATIEPNVHQPTQINIYKPNYFALKFGAYLPQASDVENFDDSFYGEIGFGHYLNRNIAMEIAAGYTKSSASVSVPGASANVDLTIIPVTLGLKILYPGEGFEPFVMAGIGMYYVDADLSATVSGIGSASASESDTTFGGFLGLGGNFNVTPNTYIGIEGKYFFATPSSQGIDVDVDGINLTANIGFRF